MRAGIELATRAASRRSTTRTAGSAPSIFGSSPSAGRLSLRVWQSVPHDRLAALRALGVRSGFGGDFLRLGYLKVFMDGTLGSETAWMLDGSGVQITSGDELAEIVRARPPAGFPVAVHAIGDRANRDALDAFERTREPGSRSGSASGSSTRSARARGSAALRRARRRGSVQFSHAPSDRDLADRHWAGSPTAPTRTARCGIPGRWSRTARTRPSRSSTRSRGSARACADDRRPAGLASGGGADRPAGVRGHLGHPGVAGRRRAPARQAPARLRRGPRRARPRPGDDRGRAPSGRRDDGRRPVGAQPAALGLSPPVGHPVSCHSLDTVSLR